MLPFSSWLLRGRAQIACAAEDRDEVIDWRLRDAAEEIRRYSDYHYVLINRELAESNAILSSIVRAERVRRTRIEEQIRPILESFQI